MHINIVSFEPITQAKIQVMKRSQNLILKTLKQNPGQWRPQKSMKSPEKGETTNICFKNTPVETTQTLVKIEDAILQYRLSLLRRRNNHHQLQAYQLIFIDKWNHATANIQKSGNKSLR